MARDDKGCFSGNRFLIAAIAFAVMNSAVAFADTSEVEPNNSFAVATVLPAGNIGAGSITPVGDNDYWMRAGAAQFDLLFAFVATNESTNSPDSVLDVYANNGAMIESDDDDGPDASSVVAGAVIPQNGNVFFRVTEFGGNDLITPYSLHHAIVSPNDAMPEAEGNDTADTANIVRARLVTGNVGPTDTDYFSFTMFGGNSTVVILDDDPDNDGVLTDTELSLIDKNKTTVLATGDNEATHNGNAAGPIKTAYHGTFYVKITNGGSVATNYRFVILSSGDTRFIEACCMPDGNCIEVYGGSCAGYGGVSGGPGASCTSITPCAPPSIGACCLPDCTCQEISPADCAALSGRFGGYSSTCATHNCGLTAYNSQADLLAAIPGLQIEDFEEGAVSPGATNVCGPFIDQTASSCFSAGQILPGLLLERNGVQDLQLFGDGGSYYGDGVDQYAWVSKTVRTDLSIRIIFSNNNVYVVGLKPVTLYPTTVTIDVQDIGGTSLTKVTRFTSPKGAFFGVSANVPIGRVILTNPQYIGVDDIVFGRLPDSDGDGYFDALACRQPCAAGSIADCTDNCPTVANPDQADADANGIGDACTDSATLTVPAPCGVCAPSILPVGLLPFFLFGIRKRRRRLY